MDKDVELYNGDCLEWMKDIPDNSIDMVLCDLPYGTTVCKWDCVIPFDELWQHYERIIKDNGAIVLFGTEPFSSKLRISNQNMWKYDWIWEKSKVGNIFNVKNSPLKIYEIISVFSKGSIANGAKCMMKYYPQGIKRISIKKNNAKRNNNNTIQERRSRSNAYIQSFTNYPCNILRFKSVVKSVHPTQKPVDLLAYLIKTYTNEGEVVLDNTMGSGSTGVAAVLTNRKFIGIELDENYFQIANKRISDAVVERNSRLF